MASDVEKLAELVERVSARVGMGSAAWDCVPAVEIAAAFIAEITQPAASGEVVAWSVLQIGNRGAYYDPPNTHRAFTYEHQPGNVDASRLAGAWAATSAASAGDSIDRGLSLLKELQAVGFGVFQIGPETATPQPDDDTVRDAERYRAWRMLAVTGTMSNWACERLIHARTETDIDAAIDSAIKGEK